jgi:hypothetical protein
MKINETTLLQLMTSIREKYLCYHLLHVSAWQLRHDTLETREPATEPFV